MKSTRFYAFGVVGLALAAYATERTVFAARLPGIGEGTLALFSLTALVLLIAALANLAIGYGLSKGRVQAVSGLRSNPRGVGHRRVDWSPWEADSTRASPGVRKRRLLSGRLHASHVPD